MDSAPTSFSNSAKEALMTEITKMTIKHKIGNSLANLMRLDNVSPKRA